jgi:hypothetical protein
VSSAAEDAQLNDDHLVQITGESEGVQDTSNLDIVSVRITTANQLASVNIADVANPVVVLSAKFGLTFSPNGIAIDANGTLFVSNNMNIPGSDAGAIQTCAGSDGGTIACEPLAITQFISRNLRVNADGIVIDASNNIFLSAYDFTEQELEKRSSWVFKISGHNLDCLENLHVSVIPSCSLNHAECSSNHAECSSNHAACSLNHATCSLKPNTAYYALSKRNQKLI